MSALVDPARILVAALIASGLVGGVYFGAMLGYGLSPAGARLCERGVRYAAGLIVAGLALAGWLGQ